MKKSMILVTVAALAAPYLMASSAIAFEYPKLIYVAKYEVSNPQGRSELILGCDGKGHAFLKTLDGTKSRREFVSYQTGTKTTLDDEHKAALYSKMSAEDAEAYDMDRFRRNAKKELGSKTVEGHPCKGYKYGNSGSTSDVWIGDDNHVMVFSESEMNNEKVTLTLKELNTKPVAAEFEYEIPSDYKVISEKENVQKPTGDQK